MATRLKLRRMTVEKQIRKGLAAGLNRATTRFREQSSEAVSQTGDGRKNASAPGEPPREVSGRGKEHIMSEVDEQRLAARVGVARNGLHLAWLEIGTRRVSPRPWLLPTLLRERKTLARLITRRTA